MRHWRNQNIYLKVKVRPGLLSFTTWTYSSALSIRFINSNRVKNWGNCCKHRRILIHRKACWKSDPRLFSPNLAYPHLVSLNLATSSQPALFTKNSPLTPILPSLANSGKNLSQKRLQAARLGCYQKTTKNKFIPSYSTNTKLSRFITILGLSTIKVLVVFML